jgi:hypothetical protein
VCALRIVGLSVCAGEVPPIVPTLRIDIRVVPD